MASVPTSPPECLPEPSSWLALKLDHSGVGQGPGLLLLLGSPRLRIQPQYFSDILVRADPAQNGFQSQYYEETNNENSFTKHNEISQTVCILPLIAVHP
jgi:hypothetical protein